MEPSSSWILVGILVIAEPQWEFPKSRLLAWPGRAADLASFLLLPVWNFPRFSPCKLLSLLKTRVFSHSQTCAQEILPELDLYSPQVHREGVRLKKALRGVPVVAQ